MKKLLLLFSAIFILIACTEESVEIAEVGEASFSFTEANRNTFSSVISSNRISASTELATQITSAQSSGENPSAILVTIIDSNNEVVIDNQQLTLLSFGNDFVTESIGLDVGDYQITSFSVINDENRIIYATPLQSSQLAQLVSNPLNIPFTVNSNQTTTVVPEVIMVLDTDSPEQFGFVSFSFNVVETQSLFVIANEVVNGIATDIDATYTLTVQNSDFTLSGTLESGSNALILPILDDATEITITVTNTTESITQVITASQIANNNAASPLTFFFNNIQNNQLAQITDTFNGDTGELRLNLGSNNVIPVGMMSVNVSKSVSDADGFISLFGSSLNSFNSLIRIRLGDDVGQNFSLTNEFLVDTNAPEFINDQFYNIVITWDATVTGQPELTVTIDGQALTSTPFPSGGDIAAIALGVQNVQFTFGSQSNVVPAEESFLVDNLMIYDTSSGSPVLVFEDDFESYTVGNSLDPDAATAFTGPITDAISVLDTPYVSNSFQATVANEN